MHLGLIIMIMASFIVAGQIALAVSLLPALDSQCQRAQLYGCSGKGFTGSCEDSDLGYTGVCYKTKGLFHDNLASARSNYPTGAVFYTNENCTSDYLWVDANGQSEIEKQYQSYLGIFIPG